MILPLADRVKVLDDWEAGETQTCLWDCTHLNPCSLNVRLLMLSGCRCICESHDTLPTKACLPTKAEGEQEVEEDEYSEFLY